MRASHRRILFTALASELAVTLVPQWTRLEFVAAGPGGTVHPVMQSAGFHFLFAPPTAGLSQAIDFMIANTVLAENNIVNEVDRYITRPGQALAYKLGQREIFALRAEAKEKLGSRFDIRTFHDVILSPGAVDLGTLRQLVEEWIQAEKARS